jgi:ElaB/YqjD/DUF883 family membrane-anchored ribosome-binding protein
MQSVPDKLDAKLGDLINGAEELLMRLADAGNPEMQHLRDRVDHAISDANRALTKRRERLSIRLADIARSVDDYVHDYPWLAVATSALAVGTAAFIAGAVVGSKKRYTRAG